MTVRTYPRGVIHQARAEDVYPTIEPGSVRLIISDGPYGLGKAAWDRQRTDDDLRDWYRPHVEAWGRVAMDAATVYLWGTDDSASALRSLMAEHGWTRRVRVTWDKGTAFMAGKCDVGGLTRWYDVTEVCDMYTRVALESPGGAGQAIAYAAGGDSKNAARDFLRSEWSAAGLRPRDADKACGVKCMASRHYFPADQWWLPTWEHFQALHTHATANGPRRERPYLVHPAVWPGGDLRASYEAMRVPFSAPVGVSNVWQHNQVAGAERLKGPDGKALHPCQKPLLFAERMILASSRPGDLVLEPFGGTCRVAVATERLPEPDARRYICVEPDEDGRDYLAAVDHQLRERLP